MANVPIMSTEEECFMAFSGLVQWTQAVILQSKRIISDSEEMIQSLESQKNIPDFFSSPNLMLNCEHHYFVIAAYKVIEHRNWIKKFGLCNSVDFSEIDSFSERDIRDLRNMREHVVEYFAGDGRAKDRWVFESSNYSADASSCIDSMIGGRLDYVKFAHAANRLLSYLREETIPFPVHD